MNELTMRRVLSTGIVLAVAVSACSDDLGFTPPSPDLFVVQAYLYAGEPVTDVTVTGVLPIGADSGEVPSPISDATIVLSRGPERFSLVPTADSAGRYHYPGTDLVIRTGDQFNLEVTVGSRTATATTVVPEPPAGLTLSHDTLDVDTEFTFPPSFERLVIRWSNPQSLYHFVVTENMDANPTPIFEGGGFFVRRRISAPTSADSTAKLAPELGYFGNYRLKLYRVRDEYVDLYRGRQQDSRDLNEPPTNIRGALGIFTAFAADSAFFVVR